MEKLLVATSDRMEGRELAQLIGAADFDVTRAASFEAVRRSLQSSNFAVAVVAGPLDRLNSLEACRAIRATTTLPVVSVVHGRRARDRITVLRAGADDALSKPYVPEELVARIRAVLRRIEHQRRAARVVEYREIAIDLVRQEVRVRGARVHLTPIEFRLLVLLACTPGRPFTRREILEHLWDSPHVGDDRVCDVYVSNLRKKIERDPGLPRNVLTVRGFGYEFVGD